MGFIKEIFTKVDGILNTYMQPIVDKVVAFLTNGSNTVIAVIGVFAALLILIGLIRWLRKAPKLFIFVVLIFGLVVGAWVISK